MALKLNIRGEERQEWGAAAPASDSGDGGRSLTRGMLSLLQANGAAERDAALLMTGRICWPGGVTVAADNGYDTKEFIKEGAV